MGSDFVIPWIYVSKSTLMGTSTAIKMFPIISNRKGGMVTKFPLHPTVLSIPKKTEDSRNGVSAAS